MLGKARAAANRAFAETIPVGTNGHGDGHDGDGHAVESGEEHAAVGSAPGRPGGGHGLPAGDAAEEEPREGG